MQLSGYLVILRRWVWTLFIAVWVAALLGYVVASRIAPTYETETRLLVGPVSADYDTLRASGQLAQTYAEYVTSSMLLSLTIDEVGLEMSSEKLAGLVKATADETTRFLTIRVQGDDPTTVVRAADSLARGLIVMTTQSPTRPEGEVTVAQPAVLPTSPIAPEVTLIVLIAAAAGFLAAVLLVVVAETLTDTVRSPQDVTRASGAEVLGTVPPLRPGERDAWAPETSATRAYRALAATLALRVGDANPQSLTIAPVSKPNDGWMESVGLAMAMTGVAAHVVLLDAAGDLAGTRSVPSTDRLDVEHWEPLAGGALIDRDAIDLRIDQLGRRRGRSMLLVHAGEADDPRTLIWARASRGAVLSVVKDRTRRSEVAAAAVKLERVGARVIGAILVEEERGVLRRQRLWQTPAETPPAPASARAETTPTPAPARAETTPTPAPARAETRRSRTAVRTADDDKGASSSSSPGGKSAESSAGGSAGAGQAATKTSRSNPAKRQRTSRPPSDQAS